MIKGIRRRIAEVLVFLLAAALPAAAVSTYTGFTTRATGYVVQATDWNNEFSNFINHYNNNVIATLNLFTAKGHLLTFDGTNFGIITNAGASDTGKVLTFDNTLPLGWKLAAVTNATQLTTKGDILTYDSNLARLPIGADGQLLTARSTAPQGVDWEVAPTIPSGLIAMWGGAIGSIPAGWALCDGQSHSGTTTPNLQGLFIAGAGNVSPAAANGLGLLTNNSTGGVNTHGHSVTTTVGTTFVQGGGATAVGTAGAATSNCGGANNIPAYYALCYIQKL